MKFNFAALDAPIEADWPVTIKVPQDGGKTLEQYLTVRFRMGSEVELAKLGDGVEGSIASIRAVVVGFGKNEETPFTPELLEKMLAAPYVRLGLLNGYREFALGLGKTVAGN